MNSHRKRIGLVIGSGGVKCAAAIGLLNALKGTGLDLDLVVGCSGGSLYASTIALGLTPAEMAAVTAELWTPALMEGYTHNLAAYQKGEKRFTHESGLVNDERVNAVLQTAFGDKTFADTQLPLYIVATDFRNGETVVLDSGRLFDATRASVAIPTVFPPWAVAGRLLVDGATSNPLPTDVAIKNGADIIIAMGFELELRPRIRSLTAANTHLVSIYTNQLLRTTLAFNTLSHHDEIIVIVPEFEQRIGTFDTHLIPDIIAAGEKAAAPYVEYLGQLL